MVHTERPCEAMRNSNVVIVNEVLFKIKTSSFVFCSGVFNNVRFTSLSIHNETKNIVELSILFNTHFFHLFKGGTDPLWLKLNNFPTHQIEKNQYYLGYMHHT